MAINHSIYVYDPMDEPLDWLTERGVRVTQGAPVYSTGYMRPKMTEDAMIEAAAGHAGLLGASGARITRRVLDGLPDLRFISKLGIGTEIVDLAAATERGVMVTNTPVHSEVALVAEHAIALMLGLTKKLNVYAGDWVRGGRWKDPGTMSGTLRGATVGIVGFGNIGQAVAARLQGWGASILAADPRPLTPPGHVRMVDVETLLRTCDYVTLHAPGGPAGSPPLLGAEQLDMLKPGAIVINTARGTLIDTAALTERLRDGRLGGAGVDVYHPEPPDTKNPLLSLDNVLCTPHAAAWHPPLRKEMAQMAFENAWTILEGKIPDHLVNPEVLDVLGVAR